MKTKTLLMVLAAFLIMLTACGDKQANKTQNTDSQKNAIIEEKTEAKAAEGVDAEEDMTEEGDVSLSPGQIAAIRRVWESKPLTGVAADGMADIERFAYAFCKEYSDYEANKAICDYLESPTKYNEENTRFRVESQKKSGYISCMAELQVSWDTEGCYWKRNNGHSLVAFWMEQGHENNPEYADQMLVFYDYDLATDTMTPEPALSKMVNDAMTHYDGGYTVRLPKQGKDIDLTGHKINYEEDNCDNTYYILRWNGNDFNLERTEE